MNFREVARKLRRLGCQEIPRRTGTSHRKWTNPATGKSTIVPDHGSKDLKPGTLRAIVRQLGLSWEQFNNA